MKKQTINASYFKPLMIVALTTLMIIASFPKAVYAEPSADGTTDAATEQSKDAATLQSADAAGEQVVAAPIDIQWEKYEPCNELIIDFEVLGTTVIAGKTTKHGPAVIWCGRELSADEQNILISSFKGNPGVGNPKAFEFIFGDAASAYGMTVMMNDGKVVFEAPHDWALLYVGALTEKAPAEDSKGGSENTPPEDPKGGSENTPPEDSKGGSENTPPEDPKGGSENPPVEPPTDGPLDGPVIPPEDVPEYIPDYVPEEPPVDEPPVDEPPVEPPEDEPPVDEPPIEEPPIDEPPEEPAPQPPFIPTPQPATKTVINEPPVAEPPATPTEVQPATITEVQPATITEVQPASNTNKLVATPTRVLDVQPKTGRDGSAPVKVSAMPKFTANFTALTAQNSDLVGWLSIDGTHINYPLMKSAGSPDYYLKHDFYKKSSVSGTPYIGSGCDLESDNAIIYGHNMENGTMFSDLLLYQNEQFFREHSKILIQTAKETAEYDILAVFKEKVHYQDESNVFRYYNYVGELSQADFDEYVSTIKSVSLYETGNTAVYGDQLITLSTCSHLSKNGRFVVVAVKNSGPLN